MRCADSLQPLLFLGYHGLPVRRRIECHVNSPKIRRPWPIFARDTSLEVVCQLNFPHPKQTKFALGDSIPSSIPTMRVQKYLVLLPIFGRIIWQLTSPKPLNSPPVFYTDQEAFATFETHAYEVLAGRAQSRVGNCDEEEDGDTPTENEDTSDEESEGDIFPLDVFGRRSPSFIPVYGPQTYYPWA
ncbi:hypothetical protein BDN72DRAFT_963874 [Pluteus cervinus]|uniref:Uncharacterized protein n=1 Tax=Pluteus cervinus TaxID=181527 RepID=A0ACD3ADK2_9AGAR|nr:hypothetical protein BDN72DRAFT_963874 [Pluteus cervinus]